MKIAFIGLDASGKTSFLSTLKKKYSLLWDLKPTKGIQRDVFSFLNQDISLWDYGGQQNYRRKYLQGRDLEGIQLIFYLLDVRNSERFDESIEYLQSIMSYFDESARPKVIICFHKFDPDLQKNANLIDQTANLQTKITSFISSASYFNTSVFEENSLWKAFSIGIRYLSSGDDLLFEYLEKLSSKTKAKGISIIDAIGVSVSSYVLDSDADWVIESCISSFLEVWKDIQIRGLNPGGITFEIANGAVYFNHLDISGFNLFSLAFFSKKENYEAFLKQVPDLEVQLSAIIDTFFSNA